jgi:hypothetical protein
MTALFRSGRPAPYLTPSGGGNKPTPDIGPVLKRGVDLPRPVTEAACSLMFAVKAFAQPLSLWLRQGIERNRCAGSEAGPKTTVEQALMRGLDTA